LSNLIVISSIFLIIYTAKDLFLSLKNKSFPNLSRIFSHLGFGLLIFFISINHNFTIEEDFNLKVGDKKKFENYNIHFVSLKMDKKQNYKSITGIFNIDNLNNLSTKELNPEIRIYNQPETLTYEASIRSGFTHDLYLTMSNISRTDVYNIKFQKKPFMLWIWISAIMISIGGFLRIFKNEN
jgi:cytochrome c-type biogenesis protein CcmF